MSVPFLNEGDGFGECLIDVIASASASEPKVVAGRSEHFGRGVEAGNRGRPCMMGAAVIVGAAGTRCRSCGSRRVRRHYWRCGAQYIWRRQC